MPRDLATGCNAPTTFVIADLHFGDKATAAARRALLPGVGDIDAELVRRWNSVVTRSDTVFVLGDIGRGRWLSWARELRGHKHLIAGNGDDIAAIGRTDIFASVCVARWLPGMLLTHIPVHPSQLRQGAINVHGHLHARSVDDARYVCVSVEQTDFAPIPVHEIHRRSSSRTYSREPRRALGGAGQGDAL